MSIERYYTKEELETQAEVKRLRKQLLNSYGVKGSPLVNVPFIPNDFERFGSTNDYWAKVHFPNGIDVVSCVYKFRPPAEFPKHHHSYSELILVLKGVVRVLIYSGDKDNLVLISDTVIKKNQSIFIPAGLYHEAYPLKDEEEGEEETVIQCNWNTNQAGWIANFLTD